MVWGKDLDRAFRVAARTGTVWITSFSMCHPIFSFGGTSNQVSIESGQEGLEAFTVKIINNWRAKV
jgi:acyl-CoA reductase-like NAD-dependent aldehyde dehydrogenase